jgi:hypothetical protein
MKATQHDGVTEVQEARAPWHDHRGPTGLRLAPHFVENLVIDAVSNGSKNPINEATGLLR